MFIIFLQAILASKDSKLEKYQEKIAHLEGQLKAVEQHSNRATFVKMKKVRNAVCTYVYGMSTQDVYVRMYVHTLVVCRDCAPHYLCVYAGA